jgi:hypothetical protein
MDVLGDVVTTGLDMQSFASSASGFFSFATSRHTMSRSVDDPDRLAVLVADGDLAAIVLDHHARDRDEARAR